MSSKLTYEYVKQFIENEGYKLLSTEYINAQKKLKIQCPKGHEYEVKYGNFYSGRRCPECAKENQRKRFGYTYKQVQKYIELFNYKLISENYINNKQLLKMICPNNHEIEMRLDNFVQGQRCPYCQNMHISFNDVYDYFQKFDYLLTITEEEYKGTYQKVSLVCPAGHNIEMYVCNFRKGHRCNICHKISYRGENSATWNGGLSSINNHFRCLLSQPNGWVSTCLKLQNYTCQITGIHYRTMDSLHVHHLFNFHKIVHMVFESTSIPIRKNISQYSIEELIELDSLLLKYHTSDIGIVLLSSIHKLYHSLYGNDNTIEQFNEFKQRLKSGEFDGFLKENNIELII